MWVKNEWSRFLKLMAKDKSKHLIPCYKNIDAYDMPEEFARLQAQDMGKVGAVQDLLRGIEKLLPRKTEETMQDVVQQVIQTSGPNASSLTKRARIFLEDGNWKDADKYAENVLDMDPENAEAYLIKTLAPFHLHCEEEIAEQDVEQKLFQAIEKHKDFQKFYRYAPQTLIERIQSYPMQARKYYTAIEMQNRGTIEKLQEASKLFAQIAGYKDSAERAETCKKAYLKIEEDNARREAEKERDEVYQKARIILSTAKSKEDYIAARDIFARIYGRWDTEERLQECVAEISRIEMLEEEKRREVEREKNYLKAMEILNSAGSKEDYFAARDLLRRANGYGDAAQRLKECVAEITRIEEEEKKRESYQKAMEILDSAKCKEDYFAARDLLRRANGCGDAENRLKECIAEISRLEMIEREETEKKREEAERKAKERAAQEEKRNRLTAEKDRLAAELPTLKGLFSGGKRKQIEARIAEIDTELAKL